MHARIKIGTGALAAAAAAILVFPAAANADYAPGPKDVVGVGSDTLQALVDFVADGSYAADPGYNGTGLKYKFISIDATADANTRLAYGPGGANGFGTNNAVEGCGPGTGGGIGTGNATSQDTNTAHLPCVLKPTVVLRAGVAPEQRPNGSGDGYKLLFADTNSSGQPLQANSTVGWGLVNFSRASSGQNANNANFDSITVGTDDLAMLTGSTTNAGTGNFTVAQLQAIYGCTDTTWSTVPSAGLTSGNTIYAMLPQVGSGTRKQFLIDIGPGGGAQFSPGTCVHNVEENDPEAISDSGVPADAIEPMSNTRLNLFRGIGGSTGTSINSTGYFTDPSCLFPPGISLTVGTANPAVVAACEGTSQTNAGPAALNPAVTEHLTGAAQGGGTTYDDNRNLYIYFRKVDTFQAANWQPGSTQNWVRTMFYNPCTGTGTTYSQTANTLLTGTAAATAGCQTDDFGNLVGPAGEPYFATGAAQAAISDAGVQPTWHYNPTPV